MDSRAQGELVGTVLITAVVIISTVTVGMGLLANYDRQVNADRSPSNFQSELTATSLTLTHVGGEDIPLAELDLVLRSDGSEQRYDLDDPSDLESDTLDGNDRFQGGESVTVSHSFTGEVRILLVRTNDGGAVLYDTTESVPTSTGTATATPTPTATPTATPTPTPQEPMLEGYSLQDNTANSNVEYDLFYDVNNTARFDRVEVTFDNRNNDWGDETVTGTDARGNVTFSQGGEEGSEYEITIRVFNTEGTVTDTVSFTDVADGDSQSDGDVTDSDSPQFAGTVIDDLGGSEANYEVSYNVTNRTNFGTVRVRYENLDSGGADATYTSTDPRNNVDDYAEASFGGTGGDEYRITVQLLDDAGVIVDERVVTDVADGTDPSGNADLSRPTSPTLDSVTIQDSSRNSEGNYRIRYQVSDPNDEFVRTEVLVRDLNNSWASTELSGTNTNGNLQYSQGGTEGDTFRFTVRVIDTDGIVVDERVITDVADGTDP